MTSRFMNTITDSPLLVGEVVDFTCAYVYEHVCVCVCAMRQNRDINFYHESILGIGSLSLG